MAFTYTHFLSLQLLVTIITGACVDISDKPGVTFKKINYVSATDNDYYLTGQTTDSIQIYHYAADKTTSTRFLPPSVSLGGALEVRDAVVDRSTGTLYLATQSNGGKSDGTFMISKWNINGSNIWNIRSPFNNSGEEVVKMAFANVVSNSVDPVGQLVIIGKTSTNTGFVLKYENLNSDRPTVKDKFDLPQPGTAVAYDGDNLVVSTKNGPTRSMIRFPGTQTLALLINYAVDTLKLSGLYLYMSGRDYDSNAKLSVLYTTQWSIASSAITSATNFAQFIQVGKKLVLLGDQVTTYGPDGKKPLTQTSSLLKTNLVVNGDGNDVNGLILMSSLRGSSYCVADYTSLADATQNSSQQNEKFSNTTILILAVGGSIILTLISVILMMIMRIRKRKQSMGTDLVRSPASKSKSATKAGGKRASKDAPSMGSTVSLNRTGKLSSSTAELDSIASSTEHKMRPRIITAPDVGLSNSDLRADKNLLSVPPQTVRGKHVSAPNTKEQQASYAFFDMPSSRSDISGTKGSTFHPVNSQMKILHQSKEFRATPNTSPAAPSAYSTSEKAMRPRIDTNEVMRNMGLDNSKPPTPYNPQTPQAQYQQVSPPPQAQIQVQAPVPAVQQTVYEYAFFNPPSTKPETPPAARSIAMNATAAAIISQLSDTNTSLNTTKSSQEYTTTYTQVHTMISNQRELAIPGFLQFKQDTDYKLRQQVAKGGTSSVFIAKVISAEMKIRANGAVNCIAKKLDSVEPLKEEIVSFSQEISLMWYFRSSKNFVKLLGFTTAPPTIIMKYYERGSLSDLIYNDPYNTTWTSHLTFCVLRDIATGLKEMHENGFVHCDIKPGNILIDEDETGIFAALADFGISRIVTSSALLVEAFQIANIDGASVSYAAPEVIRRITSPDNVANMNNVNPDIIRAGDVYSFSLVAHEVINRKVPWPKAMPTREVMTKVLSGQRPEWTAEVIEKKSIDRKLAGLCDIVSQCWVDDPLARLQMKWIVDILEQIHMYSITKTSTT